MGKRLSWLMLLAYPAGCPGLGLRGAGQGGTRAESSVSIRPKRRSPSSVDVKADTANPDYSGAPITFSAAQGGEGPGRRPQGRDADEAGHQGQKRSSFMIPLPRPRRKSPTP